MPGGHLPLALKTVAQHADTGLAGDGRAHETAVTGFETGRMIVPPCSDLIRIRPRQAVIWVHIDMGVFRIVIGACLRGIHRLALQAEGNQIDTGYEAEGFASHARRRFLGHLPKQPRHVRWIADEPRTLNLAAPGAGLICHPAHQLMSGLHAFGLQAQLQRSRLQLGGDSLAGSGKVPQELQSPFAIAQQHRRPSGPEAALRILIIGRSRQGGYKLIQTQLTGRSQGTRPDNRLGILGTALRGYARIHAMHCTRGYTERALERHCRLQQPGDESPQALALHPSECRAQTGLGRRHRFGKRNQLMDAIQVASLECGNGGCKHSAGCWRLECCPQEWPGMLARN